MIDAFEALPSHPRIYLCLPIPSDRKDWGINDSTIVNGIIPRIREVAHERNLPVIDLHSLSGLYPMNDAHARYFHDRDTDRLHPNAEGHRRMALTLMYQLLALPASFR